MSHQIDFSNNRANMAYVGATPWHKLGTQLNPDASIDEWKIAAGMSWHIEQRPLAYGVKDATGAIVPRTVENLFAHVRSDTQAMIGTGSKDFKLLQPGDTLEFFRDVVKDSRFAIETAGCLKGGAQFWALARCNLDVTLNDNDKLKSYLFIATANDAGRHSMSTITDFTSVRVVCNNTLSIAVGSNASEKRIKIPHSRQFDADAVKAQLGLIDERLETFAWEADQLTQRKMNREEVTAYFVSLFAKYDDNGDLTNKRTLNSVMPKLLKAYQRGPGAELDSARGTAWGAVNAVTNYVDFQTRARSQENRFASSQMGDGAKLKQQAFADALALVA